MEMTNDKPTPTWRNFAAWSAVGAGCYVLAVLGGVSLLQEDGMGATAPRFRSKSSQR